MAKKTNSFDLSRDLGFQSKVRYYFFKAAVAVCSEAEATPNHGKRLSFAGKILYGEISNYQLASAVSCLPDIQTKVDNGKDYDSILEISVNSVYDAFAKTVR